MTYVIISNKASPCLQNLKEVYPTITNLINEIETELNLRLWHQLSDHLVELCDSEVLINDKSAPLITLYNDVILTIESVFNPMKLMLMLSNVLKNFNNQHEAYAFLNEIDKRIKPKGEEGLFMSCLRAQCLLRLDSLYDCEDILKDVRSKLGDIYDVDHIVYSYFYKLYALYYDKKQNYDEFYFYALQFFAYYKESQISQEEKLLMCYKMAVSLLIGEKKFNFAELIEKEYFSVLMKSKYEWIYYLIMSFNSAKVEQFNQMLVNYKTEIANDSVLSSKLSFLSFKIKIAALLDLIFQKNKNERVISYNEIKTNCCCNNNEIELIVMKGLSLGLIRGLIDEVENKVIVKWIQPKYLDRSKISMLSERIDNWIDKSKVVLDEFELKSKKLVN